MEKVKKGTFYNKFEIFNRKTKKCLIMKCQEKVIIVLMN